MRTKLTALSLSSALLFSFSSAKAPLPDALELVKKALPGVQVEFVIQHATYILFALKSPGQASPVKVLFSDEGQGKPKKVPLRSVGLSLESATGRPVFFEGLRTFNQVAQVLAERCFGLTLPNLERRFLAGSPGGKLHPGTLARFGGANAFSVLEGEDKKLALTLELTLADSLEARCSRPTFIP